ncbi:MAG: PilN domain-containing protein [Nitrososphaera sp.]|nr:PilN domain-containing protein [Nitrososphaera sp.]
MLKVNLLPDSARKATLSPIEQFHRTPLMWIIVTSVVGSAFLLWGSVFIKKTQLNSLGAKIAVLQPKKKELDQIQKIVQGLRAQEEEFKSVKQEQDLWSKRLNILSDVTPDGVWFTELLLDPVKGLVIQGSAVGQGGSEMVHVGRLVQDLKDDTDFASAVKDIQIESIKRIPDKEVEIVQFTLACALHEKEAPQ